jgi:hypothetical protein
MQAIYPLVGQIADSRRAEYERSELRFRPHGSAGARTSRYGPNRPAAPTTSTAERGSRRSSAAARRSVECFAAGTATPTHGEPDAGHFTDLPSAAVGPKAASKSPAARTLGVPPATNPGARQNQGNAGPGRELSSSRTRLNRPIFTYF